jgi:hypothetical protein
MRAGVSPWPPAPIRPKEGMGVKFVAMQQEDRARFARWLKRLASYYKALKRTNRIREIAASLVRQMSVIATSHFRAVGGESARQT